MREQLIARADGAAQLGDLDAEDLQELDDAVRVLQLARGEVLVRVGEEALEVFIVHKGQLEAIGGDGEDGAPVLATFGTGSVIGEVAAMTGGTRTATLRASMPAVVSAMPVTAFNQLLDEAPQLAARLAAEAERRLHANRLARHLATLFPDLAPETVGELARSVGWRTLEPGERLFAQGDAADAAYLVVTGRVRILTDAQDGAIEPLTEAGAGRLVGETALLEDGTRAAHVVAARRTVLARLSREDFELLALREPGVALPVARLVLQRNRDAMATYRRAAAGRVSVGLLPLETTTDIRGLADALRTRFAAMGSTAHLTSAAVDRTLGSDGLAHARPGTPAGLRLERYLDEVEERHELVLLEGEAAVSPWTRRCVQQVDHLVLVANAADHTRLTELERLFVTERELPHQRVSLVLLHDPDVDRPRDTADWLDGRDVDQHHHVRRGRDADLDRLARHLAGRAVTLVLSGGGAKGFGHLAVVRALQELGVPIDAVAGSSMGAAMAGLTALDEPADALIARAVELFADVIDYTAPVSGLIAARKIERAINRGADGRAIEDLWLPYFCVSTNLTRSRRVLHRRGDFGFALRASMSIPGIMPPVPQGEDLLVDGGVLDNLPVETMRRLHPTGTVIASDAAPVLGPRARSDYGLHVRGGRVLARRMVPGMRAPKVPRLMATLMRSLLVAAAESRDRVVAQGLADLYLQVDAPGVSLLAFDQTEKVVAAAYDDVREQLDAWIAEHPLP